MTTQIDFQNSQWQVSGQAFGGTICFWSLAQAEALAASVSAAVKFTNRAIVAKFAVRS